MRPPPGRPFDPLLSFAAKDIRKDGALLRLRGDVEIKFNAKTTLLADEVDYNWNTGELDARGNVHFPSAGDASPKQ